MSKISLVSGVSKFNQLTYLSEYAKNPRKCLFRCDCKNEKVIDLGSVRSGNTKSCGCLKNMILESGKTKFGKLTYISEHSLNPRKCLFECECGNRKVRNLSNTVCGKTVSCGCVHKAAITKHGMSGTGVYKSWTAMIERCTYEGHPQYHHYGGAGVKIHPDWMEFEKFYAYVGDRPLGKSLDRWPAIRGDYVPGNVRWGTDEQQNRGKKKSIIWNVNGTEYDALIDASRAVGKSISEISRMCKGHKSKGIEYPPKPGCSFRLKYPDPNE